MSDMKYITREEASKIDDNYKLILETEKHHDHKIVKINGVLRWEENKLIRTIVDNIDFNDLISKLITSGYNKNSEIYRELYRNMGYSLSGYWEIFYWEMNNEDAEDYKPPESAIEPGPDCSSTPEDVAETNELESLRSMREEVQNVISSFWKDYQTIGTGPSVLMKAFRQIDKVVNRDD